jgi:hypothetical protein
MAGFCLLTAVCYQLYLFAGHDQQRFHLEAGIIWAQAIGVVKLVNIDQFFCAGDNIYWHIIVATVLQYH